MASCAPATGSCVKTVRVSIVGSCVATIGIFLTVGFCYNNNSVFCSNSCILLTFNKVVEDDVMGHMEQGMYWNEEEW